MAEKPLSQKEEDLLSEVTYLRKQIPNDYKEKLARENIQYFKELRKMELKPTAVNFKHDSYQLELSDELLQKQIFQSKISEIQQKCDNLMNCLAMHTEQ